MIDLKNDLIDLTISVPSTWKMIPREQFEENNIDKRTLFLFITEKSKYVSFMYQCKLREKDFLRLYEDNIENLKKEGMEIVYEGALKTSGKIKTLKYAFVNINNGDSKIRIMQNFFLFNDYFINVSTEVNHNINAKNILDLMDDSDVVTLLKSILSIK